MICLYNYITFHVHVLYCIENFIRKTKGNLDDDLITNKKKNRKNMDVLKVLSTVGEITSWLSHLPSWACIKPLTAKSLSSPRNDVNGGWGSREMSKYPLCSHKPSTMINSTRGGSRGGGMFWGSAPPPPPFWGTPKLQKEG